MRLERRKFQKPEIDACLGRLRQLGYVDDRQFAEFWLEQRRQHRPRGARLVFQELRSKGVDRETAEQAFRVSWHDSDELALAVRAGQQKVRAYCLLRPHEQRTKLSQFLVRRGFDWATVRVVVDRLIRF